MSAAAADTAAPRTRIADAFDHATARGRTALICHLHLAQFTGGTEGSLLRTAAADADILVVGAPPDAPRGTERLLRAVRDAQLQVPVVLSCRAQERSRFEPHFLAAAARSDGVAGLHLPDIDPGDETGARWLAATLKYGLGAVFVTRGGQSAKALAYSTAWAEMPAGRRGPDEVRQAAASAAHMAHTPVVIDAGAAEARDVAAVSAGRTGVAVRVADGELPWRLRAVDAALHPPRTGGAVGASGHPRPVPAGEAAAITHNEGRRPALRLVPPVSELTPTPRPQRELATPVFS